MNYFPFKENSDNLKLLFFNTTRIRSYSEASLLNDKRTRVENW